MGYNFIISNVSIGIPKHSILAEIDNNLPTANDVDTVSVDVTVQQKGVAPFYYPLRLLLHCYDAKLNKTKIRKKRGVQSIIQQNSWKTFTFSNITHSCLSNLTFTLDSPYAYPGRPVQLAQRGLYHNKDALTTASLSIVNVPIPTNQNLIEAMNFYKISSAATEVPSVPIVTPMVTRTLFPTNAETMQIETFSPSPTVLLTSPYVSPPTKYPITLPAENRNATIRPPTNPHNTDAAILPMPIYVSVNHTNDSTGSSSNSSSITQQASIHTNHDNVVMIVSMVIVIIVVVIVVCIVTVRRVVWRRGCDHRMRPTQRHFTLLMQSSS